VTAMCLDNIRRAIGQFRVVSNDSNYKHSRPQEKAIKPREWIKTSPIIESACSMYWAGKVRHRHDLPEAPCVRFNYDSRW